MPSGYKPDFSLSQFIILFLKLFNPELFFKLCLCIGVLNVISLVSFAICFILFIILHYSRCNNYMDSCKTLIAKWVWCQRFQGLWLDQIRLIYASFCTWYHAFQPFRDHCPCFIVFCLLFLITVDIQHQLFHSIITVRNNINSKHSS